ncbi:hypothetical protein [Companilactobacillus farciminis]|uniref:hypothetical protein n=1 Tax=Companilactobacillus farciminis TaxID=1612 RepID=UPI00021973F8|nr:hypothetical protein [Companilactobacillus farciminis]ATO47321.1 hypothetical protein LF20184_11405 [Companilactobacillus farciminis KCTC 3681 = DSM 20184]
MKYNQQQKMLKLLIEFQQDLLLNINNETNQQIIKLLNDGIFKLSREKCQGLVFDNLVHDLVQQISLKIANGNVSFNTETRKNWSAIVNMKKGPSDNSLAYTLLNLFHR